MGLYRETQQIVLEQAGSYRSLIERNRHHVLHDGSVGNFSERHIQCIWYDAKLRPSVLHTRAGEEVAVLDCGRWNREAGPDFLHAVLEIKPGLRRVHGDVEIHTHPADWEHHGHAGDPRYQNVVAHVTFFPGLRSPNKLPAGSVEIALENDLRTNPSFRMESIDTSAYPFSARSQECQCGELLQHANESFVTRLLSGAGCYRLEQKAQGLARFLQKEAREDVLYHQTMAVLGYKQHSGDFMRLAELVPYDQVSRFSPLEAYAILVGAAGLLPGDVSADSPSENRNFVRSLWDVWWKHSSRFPDPALNWTGPMGRPANHPVRRLAGAASFFSRSHIWEQVVAILESGRGVKSLQSWFQPDGDLAFWLRHTTFDQPAAKRKTAVVGADRFAAWVNNVLLPLALAKGMPVKGLLPQYMPEQINALIRHSAVRLFGRDHNPSLYRRSGLFQQGLLQIYQDFCGTGCDDCALADAIRRGRL